MDIKYSVIGLLDDYLMAKWIEEYEQPYHHKWRPSSFGMCYRNQFWTRKHLEVTNMPDKYSLRRFWFGHLGHGMLQKQLPEKFVEVEFETNDECGHTDFISNTRYYEGKDRIVDFKFTWGYGFKQMLKKGYDLVDKKEGYLLQAVRYAMAFDKPYAEILLFDRGSVKNKSFLVEVDKYKDRVDDELDILRGYWKQDRLPPAIPRKKWQCNYCNWKDKCKQIESKRRL